MASRSAAKHLLPKASGPCPGFGSRPKSRDGIFPRHLARVIVLAHDAVPFVAHQVVAVGKLARQPSIRVRMRMIDAQLDFAQPTPGAIDFDDAARPALGDHHLAIRERLKRVYFDGPTLVLAGGAGIVAPHHAFGLGIDLGDLVRALLHYDMAIREHVQIMNAAPGHLPIGSFWWQAQRTG